MVQLANFATPYLMAGSGWSINTFLTTLNTSLNNWGSLFVTCVGVVMVIVAVVKIAKGLMSHGQGQVNWVLNIALLLIGGMLAWSGGWGIIGDMSEGANDTLNELGGGGGGGAGGAGGAIVFDIEDAGIATNFNA